MYVSTAPLISQMHASSQQFDKDGRVMNRHAVRRRAARLLPRVRRTWRRRDCGPNPSIMARRRILGPKCKRCDGKNCAARSTGRGVSDAHIHFDLPLPAHGGPLLRHPHLRHRRGRPVPARRGPQGARCGWMRSAQCGPLMSLRRRPRPVATGGWRAGDPDRRPPYSPGARGFLPSRLSSGMRARRGRGARLLLRIGWYWSFEATAQGALRQAWQGGRSANALGRVRGREGGGEQL